MHVENAQHAAQDGFFGLLGAEPVPDVAQHGAEMANGSREASAEELRGRRCESATEETDNQRAQQEENGWHAA